MGLLITGGTGFIGRFVVACALEKGHDVTVLTRSVAEAKKLFGETVNIIDLNDVLSGIVGINCSKVIHLAWSNVQDYKSENNLSDNLATQIALIDKLVESGVSDITITGTCLEYGMVEGACVETMQNESRLPVPYAAAKKALYDTMLRNYPHINLKWVRCFYVYGVGQRSKSLLTMLLEAIERKDTVFNMSMGDQQRDFIHVNTLAHNIVAIASQNDIKGIINAGNGRPVSVLEFVRSVLTIKDYDMKLNLGFYPYAENEPFSFWADVNKLKMIEGIKIDNRIWV